MKGSVNDASIWMNSKLGKALNNNDVILPQPRSLPKSDSILPFTFIGDEGFPLKTSYATIC